MTDDDFQLFQDQSGDDPVDADIALITAYLARELSPVQVVAVEERLATDAAFRRKVSPILGAWVLPARLDAVPAGQWPLSRDEVDAGWTRYVGEHAELDAHEGPRLVVDGGQRKRRKISMTRIVAGVAAVVLPVFTLAQVAVYVSHHPKAPGHSVAKTIVAPFVEPLPVAVQQKPKPLTAPVDVPVKRQLEKPHGSVQRAATVEVPPLVPVWNANPDRAKIAQLVRAHMPELVQGDTTASYIVMVMNAKDEYVWSTYGNGSLQLAIAGDRRTSDERQAAERANMIEYSGALPGGRGGFGAGADGGGRVGGRARGGGGGAGFDSLVADTLIARLRARADSIQSVLVRVDSTQKIATARIGGGAAGGGFGRGGGAVSIYYGMTVADSSGGYAIGMGRVVDGRFVDLNQAPGLQEPGKGESGIQGLSSASLTLGEQYFFAPGQLSPRPMRVFVVHLSPGASWKGR
jgi:hypothetical protein